jgi:heat-inducible transcriptional repressor
VEATCRLLGELTRYTALALVPGWQEHRLMHIEMAPVGDDQLLVMLVTENRQVMHSLSTVPDRPTPARLRQLNDLLNAEFGGKLLSAITPETLERAIAKLPFADASLMQQTSALVQKGLQEEQSAPRIYVEGTTHLFEQQDFSDMPKLRSLMEALHEESVFEQLFSRTYAGEMQVSIGAENPHPALGDCAIVFTSYQLTEHATGRVGVLGPKRMPYRRIIRTVDAVVHHLDQQRPASPADE